MTFFFMRKYVHNSKLVLTFYSLYLFTYVMCCCIRNYFAGNYTLKSSEVRLYMRDWSINL